MNTEESKYHYGREIIFNLRSCHAITPEVYLHWLDKIDKEEAINDAHSSLPLKDKEILPFEVWLHKQDVLTTKYNTYINGYQLKEGESLHTIYYKDLLNL
jgi:hypothetical protein